MARVVAERVDSRVDTWAQHLADAPVEVNHDDPSMTCASRADLGADSVGASATPIRLAAAAARRYRRSTTFRSRRRTPP
jgi:hypothetical protein